MKPLEKIQKVLSWVCVLPADEATSPWKKRLSAGFTVSIFLITAFGLLACYVSFWVFSLTDLKTALYSLFQSAVISFGLNIMIGVIILRNEITPIFASLTKIYGNCKCANLSAFHLNHNAIYFVNSLNLGENDDSLLFLAHANRKSEWICQIYYKYVTGGFVAFTWLTCAVSILVCWIINSNFDVDHVFHPYRVM